MSAVTGNMYNNPLYFTGEIRQNSSLSNNTSLPRNCYHIIKKALSYHKKGVGDEVDK